MMWSGEGRKQNLGLIEYGRPIAQPVAAQFTDLAVVFHVARFSSPDVGSKIRITARGLHIVAQHSGRKTEAILNRYWNDLARKPVVILCRAKVELADGYALPALLL